MKTVTSEKEKRKKGEKGSLGSRACLFPGSPRAHRTRTQQSCKSANIAQGYPWYFFQEENRAEDKLNPCLQSGKAAAALGLGSPGFIEAIPRDSSGFLHFHPQDLWDPPVEQAPRGQQ